jgi:hypothetical protein
MSKNNLISDSSWWVKRTNLKNKPSMSFKTVEIIDHLMKTEEIPLGIAIERLIYEDGLTRKILEDLKNDYPDIEEE